MGNLNIRAKAADELSIDSSTLTGGWDAIGTLADNPVIIIFKNNSDTEIAISDDGGSTTFTTMEAGEKILLDMRANHGIAGNFSWRAGTIFSASGAAGTGNFYISYLFAQEI